MPEYQRFLENFPGRGSLKVQVSAANDAFPVKDVYVDISAIIEGTRYLLYHDVTDSSGIVNEIVLPALLNASSLSPETAGKGEAEYLVSVYHPAFGEVTDCPVIVHDRIETILPVDLQPVVNGMEEG